MTLEELHIIAKYNSEVARGIKHTKKWKERMKKLQAIYNDHERTLNLLRESNSQLNQLPSKTETPYYQPRSPFLAVEDL